MWDGGSVSWGVDQVYKLRADKVGCFRSIQGEIFRQEGCEPSDDGKQTVLEDKTVEPLQQVMSKERICDLFSRHGRCSYAPDGAVACRNGKHVRVQQSAGGGLGAGGGKGGTAGGGNVGANAPRKTPSNSGGLPTPAPKAKGAKGGPVKLQLALQVQ